MEHHTPSSSSTESVKFNYTFQHQTEEDKDNETFEESVTTPSVTQEDVSTFDARTPPPVLPKPPKLNKSYTQEFDSVALTNSSERLRLRADNQRLQNELSAVRDQLLNHSTFSDEDELQKKNAIILELYAQNEELRSQIITVAAGDNTPVDAEAERIIADLRLEIATKDHEIERMKGNEKAFKQTKQVLKDTTWSLKVKEEELQNIKTEKRENYEKRLNELIERLNDRDHKLVVLQNKNNDLVEADSDSVLRIDELSQQVHLLKEELSSREKQLEMSNHEKEVLNDGYQSQLSYMGEKIDEMTQQIKQKGMEKDTRIEYMTTKIDEMTKQLKQSELPTNSEVDRIEELFEQLQSAKDENDKLKSAVEQKDLQVQMLEESSLSEIRRLEDELNIGRSHINELVMLLEGVSTNSDMLPAGQVVDQATAPIDVHFLVKNTDADSFGSVDDIHSEDEHTEADFSEGAASLKQQMTHTISKYEQQISELQQLYDKDVTQLEQERDTLLSKVSTLKGELELTSQSKEMSFIDNEDLIANYEQRISEMTRNFNAKLEAEKLASMSTVQSLHEDNERMRQALSDAENRFDNTVAQLENQLSASMTQADNTQNTETHFGSVTVIQKELEDELKALKADHEKQLSHLEEDFSNMKQKQKMEIEDTYSNQMMQLQEEKVQYQRTIKALEDQLNAVRKGNDDLKKYERGDLKGNEKDDFKKKERDGFEQNMAIGNVYFDDSLKDQNDLQKNQPQDVFAKSDNLLLELERLRRNFKDAQCEVENLRNERDRFTSQTQTLNRDLQNLHAELESNQHDTNQDLLNNTIRDVEMLQRESRSLMRNMSDPRSEVEEVPVHPLVIAGVRSFDDDTLDSLRSRDGMMQDPPNDLAKVNSIKSESPIENISRHSVDEASNISENNEQISRKDSDVVLSDDDFYNSNRSSPSENLSHRSSGNNSRSNSSTGRSKIPIRATKSISRENSLSERSKSATSQNDDLSEISNVTSERRNSSGIQNDSPKHNLKNGNNRRSSRDDITTSKNNPRNTEHISDIDFDNNVGLNDDKHSDNDSHKVPSDSIHSHSSEDTKQNNSSEHSTPVKSSVHSKTSVSPLNYLDNSQYNNKYGENYFSNSPEKEQLIKSCENSFSNSLNNTQSKTQGGETAFQSLDAKGEKSLESGSERLSDRSSGSEGLSDDNGSEAGDSYFDFNEAGIDADMFDKFEELNMIVLEKSANEEVLREENERLSRVVQQLKQNNGGDGDPNKVKEVRSELERSEQLSAHLQEMFSLQLSKLQDENKHLLEECAYSKEKIDELTKEVEDKSDLESKLEFEQASLREQSEAQQALQQKLDEERTSLSQLQTSLDSLREELEVKAKDEHELKQQCQSYDIDIGKLNGEIEQLKSDNATLTQQLEDVNHDTEQLRAQLQSSEEASRLREEGLKSHFAETLRSNEENMAATNADCLARLRSELDVEHKNRLQESESLLHEEYAKRMALLGEQKENELVDVKAEYENEVVRMEEKRQCEKEKQLKTIKEVMERSHANEIETLNEKHQNEIQDLQQSLDDAAEAADSLKADHANGLNLMKEEYEKQKVKEYEKQKVEETGRSGQSAEEIQRLTGHFETEKIKLQEEYKSEVEDINKQHEQEIEDLMQRHKNDCANALNEQKVRLSEEFDNNLREQVEIQAKELGKGHNEEIEGLKQEIERYKIKGEEFKQMLGELESNQDAYFKSRVEDINASHQQNIAALERENEEKLKKCEEEFETKLNSGNVKHKEQVEKLLAEIEVEREALREKEKELGSEEEDLKTFYEAQLTERDSEHKTELEWKVREMEDQYKQTLEKKLEELTNHYESSMGDRMKETEENYQTSLQKAVEDKEVEIRRLEGLLKDLSTEDTADQLKQFYEQKLDEFSEKFEDLKSKSEAEAIDLYEKLEERRSAEEELHVRLHNLKEEHAKEINNLTGDHENMVNARLEENDRMHGKQMEDALAQLRTDLTREHHIQVQEMTGDHAEIKDMLKYAYKEEMLKLQRDAELKKLNAVAESTTNLVLQHSVELVRVRKELAQDSEKRLDRTRQEYEDRLETLTISLGSSLSQAAPKHDTAESPVHEFVLKADAEYCLQTPYSLQLCEESNPNFVVEDEISGAGDVISCEDEISHLYGEEEEDSEEDSTLEKTLDKIAEDYVVLAIKNSIGDVKPDSVTGSYTTSTKDFASSMLIASPSSSSQTKVAAQDFAPSIPVASAGKGSQTELSKQISHDQIVVAVYQTADLQSQPGIEKSVSCNGSCEWVESLRAELAQHLAEIEAQKAKNEQLLRDLEEKTEQVVDLENKRQMLLQQLEEEAGHHQQEMSNTTQDVNLRAHNIENEIQTRTKLKVKALMEAKHAEFDQAKDDLLSQQSSLLEEFTVRHQYEIGNIAAQHQSEVANITDQHQLEIDNINKARDSEMASLQSKLDAILHKETMDNSTLTETTEEVSTDIVSEENDVLDELERNLRQEFDEYIETIQDAHNKQLQALQEELSNVARDVENKVLEKHEQQLATMESDIREQVEGEQEDILQAMQTEQQSAIEEINEKHDEEIEKLKTMHQYQINTIKTGYGETLGALKIELSAEHAEQLEAVVVNMKREKEKLAEDLSLAHDQEIEEIKSEHESQLQTLEEDHAKDLSSRGEEHTLEIEALKNELSEAKSAARVIKEGLQRQEGLENEKREILQDLKAKEDEIEQLRERLNNKDTEEAIKTLETQLEKLQDENRRLQVERFKKEEEKNELAFSLQEVQSQNELLFERHEREEQESSNLINILQADVSSLTKQRDELSAGQSDLHQSMTDLLRSALRAESNIHEKVEEMITTQQQHVALHENDASPLKHIREENGTLASQVNITLSNEDGEEEDYQQDHTPRDHTSRDQSPRSEHIQLVPLTSLDLQNPDQVKNVGERLFIVVDQLLQMFSTSTEELMKAQEAFAEVQEQNLTTGVRLEERNALVAKLQNENHTMSVQLSERDVELSRATTAVAERDGTCAKLQVENDKIVAEKTALAKHLEELNNTLTSKNDVIAEKYAQLEERDRHAEQLQCDFEERIAAEERKLQEVAAQLEGVQVENKHLLTYKSEKEVMFAELKIELEKQRYQHEQHGIEVSKQASQSAFTADEEIAQLNREIDHLNEIVREITDEKQELRSQMLDSGYSHKEDSYQPTEVSGVMQENEQLTAQNKTLQTKCQHLQNAFQEMFHAKSEAERELSQLKDTTTTRRASVPKLVFETQLDAEEASVSYSPLVPSSEDSSKVPRSSEELQSTAISEEVPGFSMGSPIQNDTARTSVVSDIKQDDQVELRNLDSKLTEMIETQEKLEDNLKSSENEREKLKRQLEDKNKENEELNVLKEENENMKKDLDELHMRLILGKDDLNAARRQLFKSEEENIKTNAQNEKFKEMLQNKEIERKCLCAEIAQLKSSLDERSKSSLDEFNRLPDQLEQQRNYVVELENRLEQKERELDTINTDLGELRTKLSTEARAKGDGVDFADLQRQLTESRDNEEKLRNTLESKEEQIEILEQRLQDVYLLQDDTQQSYSQDEPSNETVHERLTNLLNRQKHLQDRSDATSQPDVKGLLNDVQNEAEEVLDLVLTIPELNEANEENMLRQQNAWAREKDCLLAVVKGLKDLVAKTESRPGEELGERRIEMVNALAELFVREQQAMLSNQTDIPSRTPSVEPQDLIADLVEKDRELLLQEIATLRHATTMQRERADENITSLEREIEAVKDDHEAARLEVNRTAAEKMHLQEMLQEAHAEINQERESAKQARSRLQEELGVISQLKDSLMESQQNNESLKDLLQREQQSLQNLRAQTTTELENKLGEEVQENERLAEKVQLLSEEIGRLEQIVGDHRAKLEASQAKHATEVMNKDSLQKILQAQQVKMAKLEQQEFELKLEKEDLMEQLAREKLKNENSQLQLNTSAELLEQEREQHTEAASEHFETRMEMQDRIDFLQGEVDRLQDELQREGLREQRLAERERKLAAIKTDLHQQQTELEKLGEEQKDEGLKLQEAGLKLTEEKEKIKQQQQLEESQQFALKVREKEMGVKSKGLNAREKVVKDGEMRMRALMGELEKESEALNERQLKQRHMENEYQQEKHMKEKCEELEKAKNSLEQKLEKKSSLCKDQEEFIIQLRDETDILQAKLEDSEEEKIKWKQQVDELTNTLLQREQQINDNQQEMRNNHQQMEERQQNLQHVVSNLREELDNKQQELDDNQQAKVSEDGKKLLNAGWTIAKVQRLYLKYFRAESFRKALAYQKAYLLLLLSEFEQGEQTTLAALTRLNPRDNNNKANPQRKPRLKVVAQAVIAVQRMKYLVRKYQRNLYKSSPDYPYKEKKSASKISLATTSESNSSTGSPPSEPKQERPRPVFPTSWERPFKVPSSQNSFSNGITDQKPEIPVYNNRLDHLEPGEKKISPIKKMNGPSKYANKYELHSTVISPSESSGRPEMERPNQLHSDNMEMPNHYTSDKIERPNQLPSDRVERPHYLSSDRPERPNNLPSSLSRQDRLSVESDKSNNNALSTYGRTEKSSPKTNGGEHTRPSPTFGVPRSYPRPSPNHRPAFDEVTSLSTNQRESHVMSPLSNQRHVSPPVRDINSLGARIQPPRSPVVQLESDDSNTSLTQYIKKLESLQNRLRQQSKNFDKARPNFAT